MTAAHRIKRKFRELRARGEAALIPFIVAGDPDMDTTRRLVLELEARGADLIELGVPFSDPMADGPANQRASARGLGAGASLAAILSMVSELRAQTQIPLILFGYYNPIFHYGCERLVRGRRARGYRRVAGGRSAARGIRRAQEAGARQRSRPYLPACADDADRQKPRDRALRERLSLLRVGDGSDRRTRASRHRHRRAHARASQRNRSAYRRRLRYLDARAGCRGRDDGGCGGSRQRDFIVDRGAREVRRRA